MVQNLNTIVQTTVAKDSLKDTNEILKYIREDRKSNWALACFVDVLRTIFTISIVIALTKRLFNEKPNQPAIINDLPTCRLY